LNRLNVVVCAVVLLLWSSLASAEQNDSVPPTDEVTSQRATLLAADLAPFAPMARRVKTAQVLSIVLGGIDLGITVPFFMTSTASVRPLAAAFAGGGAAILAGGIMSYAVPEDYSYSVLEVAGDVSNGSLYLALALGAANSTAQSPFFAPPVGFMLASGYGGQAALRLIDIAVRRPVSYSTLAGHYDRIRDPQRRAAMTSNELAAVESDFERQGSWMDPYLLRLPMIVAGTSGVVYSLAARDLGDQARAWGVALSSINLVGALVMAELERASGWRLYQQKLEQTGLSVSLAPGPSGASLVGRF
jgi:hypothetical protein